MAATARVAVAWAASVSREAVPRVAAPVTLALVLAAACRVVLLIVLYNFLALDLVVGDAFLVVRA